MRYLNRTDANSNVANMNKHIFCDTLEKHMLKAGKLTRKEVASIIDAFNNGVKEIQSSQTDLTNVTEKDTQEKLIIPVIQNMLPNTKGTIREHSLFMPNIKFDIMVYDSTEYDKNEHLKHDWASFVIVESKKLAIFANGKNDTILSIAQQHGLLTKTAKTQDVTNKHVQYDTNILKGAQQKQMLAYLDATKQTYADEPLSLGIITNGLSYYVMMALYNDPNSVNQTWSILYKLDLAELVEEYNNKRNTSTVTNKISTFVNIIKTFEDLRKASDFAKWYKIEFEKIHKLIDNTNMYSSSYSDTSRDDFLELLHKYGAKSAMKETQLKDTYK